MVVRTATTIFFSLCLVTSGILAQPPKARSQSDPISKEADSTKSQQAGKSLSLSPEELKAQKELKALKSRPKEYRVLVLGVQIFLGRFGYGIGPYTGVVDENMKKALRTYQQYVGLPETGEIDFLTLKHLTEDNKTLDQPLPFLPKVAFHFEQWDKAIQVQGTWTRDSGLTDDAIQTSRISCFKEEKNCIESTAVLLNGSVPVLEVLTHVYTIKEWDEDQLVSAPYDGEPCTISILRMNRKQQTITRFAAYQQKGGMCAKVKTEDVQYHLVNGPQVYLNLKQKKAKDTKRILRVKE